MQVKDVDHVRIQQLAAAIHRRPDRRLIVLPDLRGDDKAVAVPDALQEFTHPQLRVMVIARRINEITAGFHVRFHCLKGFGFRHVAVVLRPFMAPKAAQTPGPEADFAHH